MTPSVKVAPTAGPWRADSPWASLLVLLGGALVFSSALRAQFLLDDHMHAAMVEGTAGIKRGYLDIYDFVRRGEWQALYERGLLPWWTSHRLEIRFLRPLSSLLRVIELRLLHGEAGALAMHLHSFAWWIACVLGVRTMFFRYLAPRPALLATAIFALGPWHVLPLGWLANREVLLSIAFGVQGLLAYARYRQTGVVLQALLAGLCFAIAFASGEYAFCLGGYVLAFELMQPGEAPGRRLLRLWPFVLPALAYLLAHVLGGYGTRGSSFYADPMHEPGKLLTAAPLRLALLLAEGWLTLGTEPWGATTPRWAVVCFVLVGVAVLAAALRRLRPALDPRSRSILGWFLLGSLGALAPVLAAAPGPRLLSMSAIGMAAVTAILVEETWFPREGSRPGSLMQGLAATLLAYFQLLHGPLTAAIASETLRVTAGVNQGAVRSLARHMLEHDRREVVVLRGGGSAFFGPFALAARGAAPSRWRVLSQTVHVLALVKDEHTLELVASERAPLYPEGATNLFRDEGHPLRTGDVVDLPGMRVEILQTAPSGPVRARYTFDEPLDAPGRMWVDENFIGLSPAELPAAGFGAPFDP